MSAVLTIVEYCVAVGLLGGAAYLIKSRRRTFAKWRLRRRVERLLERRLPGLQPVEFLGVGNVGAVFAARVADNWETGIELAWKTAEPLPPLVAVKLGAFRNSGERLEQLADLAERIRLKLVAEPEFPLCPFLALGMFRPRRGEPLILEVMPIIPGRNVSQLGEELAANPARTLAEYERILETVRFLEGEGFYTRNLDAENIMLDARGNWMRIDFDNAQRRPNFPLSRMLRLARLTRHVLEPIARATGSNEVRALIARAAATEAADLDDKSYVPTGDILATPGDLIAAVGHVRRSIVGAAPDDRRVSSDSARTRPALG